MSSLSNFCQACNKFATLKLNEPLDKYTSFQTGGPAEILVFPNSRADLLKIIREASQESLPITVIGGGSNLLVPDEGLRGLVICLKQPNAEDKLISFKEDGSIYAESALLKEDFINYALDHVYQGIEFMVGIPGTIGGGIFMNAGTNKGVFSDILTKVDFIDKKGSLQSVNITKNNSGYRKIDLGESSIILGGYFSLPKAENKNKLKEEIDSICQERRQKHPLEYPSAGSVFKNPKNGLAWQLIDQSGLKGFKLGGAMVSEKHTNFIINYNQATSLDIKNLIELVQEKVLQKFNIFLEPEIVFL
jgi:UDP-N-acetylmuramate dehydrogenase